jgi:hypothetical protein
MFVHRCKIALLAVSALILVSGCGGSGGGADDVTAVAPADVSSRALTGGAALSVSTSEAGPLLGDMDGDGEPSVGDAINILRIVVGLDDDSPYADANRNGYTDVGDAIMVLRCVVGLDDWPIPSEGARVTGTVRNLLDDAPLQGAVVTVGGISDTTDSSGQFVITGVPTGEQPISVTKTDYTAYGSLPDTVTVNSPVTSLGTIYMLPSGFVPPPPPPPW